METTANTQDQLVRQVGGPKKPKPPKKDILRSYSKCSACGEMRGPKGSCKC